jgi:hypothetical protein
LSVHASLERVAAATRFSGNGKLMISSTASEDFV